MRLAFPGFADDQVRVAHGARCVVVMIEQMAGDEIVGLKAGVVLTDKEAAALGRRLIQQARASQDVAAGSDREGEPG